MFEKSTLNGSVTQEYRARFETAVRARFTIDAPTCLEGKWYVRLSRQDDWGSHPGAPPDWEWLTGPFAGEYDALESAFKLMEVRIQKFFAQTENLRPGHL